jgi:predicted tellurium resistance membrane protein TerC
MAPDLFSVASLISLIILIVLEVVLGVDNVIFVSIIMDRLPENLRPKARKYWMVLGILVRCCLLGALSWLLQQKDKGLITVPFRDKPLDLSSIVMLVGGLFLIYKTIKEIHQKLEGAEHDAGTKKTGTLTFGAAMGQIVLIDLIFSFDSILTAGGTAKHIEIMITAVVIAMIVMFVFAPKIASFIQKHPTIKMLALSFLVMIGLSLVIEGWAPMQAEQLHLKNYIYFGMAFSFSVELLNMRMNKKSKPVKFNEPQLKDKEA